MSETRRVRLTSDCYLGELFDTGPELWWDDPQRASTVEGVYEVPAEQMDRWEEAQDAWEEAQTEIRALMAARASQRRAEREAREQREAEARAREEKRRAEIRASLYGGRKR